jgi:type I restriction enzyme M protein
MLDNETKRRIDTARDILVGKVPDPKSQVEQITIALIYKFMDDMDAEAEELGGKRNFFVGEYEKYSWAKLMAPGRGGHEVLNLYGEAITQMTQNEGIPRLFRDIFKNAYLPYRDPETLKSFLKIINAFTYDHSEKLGDAFEYLLSVLGSQGDAGQFRTPRHIIDFMVQMIDPKKHDTILDPACGTAGFLISSYKHIMTANAKNGRSGAALTPDERTRVLNNIQGYDISPDMVRLSLVNLYLHGFTDPHIYEYDTLTSDDRWNEYFDIIMANPPFMSPKGGIRPHNRFSVESKRSEVLFVDYIAEHLSPNGRAAVIVPEGIIFQGGSAYKQLRQMLVDKYLVGVISLPAGVFNPYSGVKTSILWLDKALAKDNKQIAFVKIESDGFDLGAQRREIKQNDLPAALAAIAAYKASVINGADFDDEKHPLLTLVGKKEIAENGDFNLSGERYKVQISKDSKYEYVRIGDVFETSSGGTPLKSNENYWRNGTIPWLKSGEVSQGFIYTSEDFISEEGLKNSSAKIFPADSVLVAMYGATAGQVGLLKFESTTNQAVCAILPNKRVVPEYLYYLLKYRTEYLVSLSVGGAQPNISQKIIKDLEIPLPPTAVQAEIVAEIESYQKIIDGARQVVENYRPRIPINPDWPLVEIESVAADEKYSIKAGPFGSSLKKEFYVEKGYKIYGQEQVIRGDASYGDYYIDEDKFNELRSCAVQKDDVLISLVGTYGKTLIIPENFEPGIINPRLMKISLNQRIINPKFFVLAFNSDAVMNQVHGMSYGGTMNILNVTILKALKLPLPDIDIQKQIVNEIEEEQALVQANRQLITRFEQKIKDRIARVWGEA